MEPLYQIGTSSIHGLGLFARRAISGGQIIVEYSGERISKTESIQRCRQANNFIFYLDEQFDLDGNAQSNPARFVNHSCSPNCVVKRTGDQLFVLANSTQRLSTGGRCELFDVGFYVGRHCLSIVGEALKSPKAPAKASMGSAYGKSCLEFAH